MSDTLSAQLTIELAKTLTFDGREYSELILREPRVKEVLRADEQLRNGVTPSSLRNRQIHLVAMVSGAPIPLIEQINISALNKAMDYLNAFLETGPATGSS